MGTAAIPYVIAAASAAAQYKNTQDTAKRQDNQAAQGILNQSRIQKRADARVNETVQKLQGSTSAEAEKARMGDYLHTLRQNKSKLTGGLTPTIGSDTFQADAANAATDTQNYAAKTAGLMARMDAPVMQRQQEGFNYGNLATDIGLIGRDSRGQRFLDQLKLNGIRRNAKIDLAAGLANAYAGASAGGAGGAVPKQGTTYAWGDGLTSNMPGY